MGEARANDVLEVRSQRRVMLGADVPAGGRTTGKPPGRGVGAALVSGKNSKARRREGNRRQGKHLATSRPWKRVIALLFVTLIALGVTCFWAGSRGGAPAALTRGGSGKPGASRCRNRARRSAVAVPARSTPSSSSGGPGRLGCLTPADGASSARASGVRSQMSPAAAGPDGVDRGLAHSEPCGEFAGGGRAVLQDGSCVCLG